MAFENVVSLKGSSKKYRLNQNLKRYTLRDQGFTETKAGNFQFIRSLDTNQGNKKGVLLKITVSKDLDSFKMSTTTANGLQYVDVYAKESMENLVTNLEYILFSLVSENVLEEV